MWQLIIVTSVCSRTTNDLEEKCWAAPSPPLVYPTPRQGHSTSTPAKWEKWKKRNENESPELYDAGNRRTELPSHGNGHADIPISLCCLLGAHQTLQSHFLVRLREMLRIPRSILFYGPLSLFVPSIPSTPLSPFPSLVSFPLSTP